MQNVDDAAVWPLTVEFNPRPVEEPTFKNWPGLHPSQQETVEARDPLEEDYFASIEPDQFASIEPDRSVSKFNGSDHVH